MKNLLIIALIMIGSHAAMTQCMDDTNQWAKSWTSCQKSANPNPLRGDSHWILYDFIENHNIDSSHIWNANRVGESAMGINEIIVDYSLDGDSWLELGTFTVPRAPETATYSGVAGPDFGGRFIKKILITVVSSHADPSCVSIGEMLFAIDSGACHGEIDVCGICNGPGERTWYIDEDGDGKGSMAQMMQACEQPFGYVDNADDECDQGQLGWQDVYPLFERSCTGCHINASAGGLNLGSYSLFAQGGNSCGAMLRSGTNLVSVITVNGYQGCGTAISIPAMNSRTGQPLSNEELALLQSWIDGGSPESCVDYCRDATIVSGEVLTGDITYEQVKNTLSSDAIINDSTKVTYDAGQGVELHEGFSVLRGALFIVKMDGCN